MNKRGAKLSAGLACLVIFLGSLSIAQEQASGSQKKTPTASNQKKAPDTPKVKHIISAPKAIVGPLLPERLTFRSRQIAACNGYTFLELDGNFYCADRCSGALNPGPDPGSAAVNQTVTYGATPSAFDAAGDVIESSGIVIDFGNGKNSPVLPLANDTGVQATTQYATSGTYHVRTTAVMQNNYVADDWHCHYRCCSYAQTDIQIQ